MTALLLFYAFMTATFQIPEVALRIYCINALGYEPSVYAMVTSTAIIPWSLKPLWGFWIDNLSYPRVTIGACTAGFMACWLVIACDMATTPVSLASMLTLSSLFICILDVMADAQTVKCVRNESNINLGKLQSKVWTVRAAGALVAAVVGGALARYSSHDIVFLITACLIAPAGLSLALANVSSPAVNCAQTHHKMKLLCSTLKKTEILRPCVFIFILSAVPSCYYALVVFMQTTLRFTPMQFAVVDACAHLAHIVGAQVYSKYLRHRSFRCIFYSGIVILIVLRLLQLVLILRLNVRAHIPDLVFCIAESVAFSIVSQVMMMPVCVLGARLCPPGIEGSLYSTLMAVSNFGGFVASWTGAGLAEAFSVKQQDFSHMWQLSVVCTAFTLIPVAFVQYVPHVAPVRHPIGETNGSRHVGQHALESQVHSDIHTEQNK
tara:strand:- start:5911 stop:7218 length:1308 start_codon:yes stop_codon:yes gene_type:complete